MKIKNLFDDQECALAELHNTIGQHQHVLFSAPTGAGKCHGIDTPILMSDGTIKMVQDVVVGDRLMGPNGKPRTVLSLGRGVGQLYRIHQSRGDPYVVNADHILSLRTTRGVNRNLVLSDGTIISKNTDCVNINVEVLLNSAPHVRRNLLGWKASAVNFEKRRKDIPPKVNLDPYILGAWLGDGTQGRPALTKNECNMTRKWVALGEQHGLHVRRSVNTASSCPTWHLSREQHNNSKSNPIIDLLRKHNVLNNRHIPDQYKYASIENRLAVIAGLMDSDGTLGATKTNFIWNSKSRQLAEDLRFICLSVGLSCSITPFRTGVKSRGFSALYWRLQIGGPTLKIPTLDKIALARSTTRRSGLSKITIEDIGYGDYYGFEIDGDHLYCLGDFTVTHNTVMGAHLLESASDPQGRFHKQVKLALGKDPHSELKTAFVVDRTILIGQTVVQFTDAGLDFGVIQANHPLAAPDKPLQICSIQTLTRRNCRTDLGSVLNDFDLVVVDECHVIYTELRKLVALNKEQKKTIIVGLTATPFATELSTLYDGRVNACTTHELIAAGRLVPPLFYRGSVLNMKGVKVKKGEWDVTQSTAKVVDVVANVVDDYLRRGEGQKFICSAVGMTHVAALVAAFARAGINAAAYTYEVGEQERRDIVAEFSKPSGITKIQGIITVSAATKGFDVPDVGCIIDARPLRTALADYVQLLGRGLRTHKPSSKTRCIVLDHSGNYQRFGSLVECFYHTGELLVLGKSESRALEIVTCDSCDYSQPRFVFKPLSAERVSIQVANPKLGQVNERFGGAHMEVLPLYDCKNCGKRHSWAPPKQEVSHNGRSSGRKQLPLASDLMHGAERPLMPIGNPNLVGDFKAKLAQLSKEERMGWLLPQICYWLATASKWQPVVSAKPIHSLKLRKRLNRLYHEHTDDWLGFTQSVGELMRVRLESVGVKSLRFNSQGILPKYKTEFTALGLDANGYLSDLVATDVYAYYAYVGVEMDAGLVYLLAASENKYIKSMQKQRQNQAATAVVAPAAAWTPPLRRKQPNGSIGAAATAALVSPIKAMALQGILGK